MAYGAHLRDRGPGQNSDELSVPRNDGSCGVWLGMYDDRGGRNIVNNRRFGRAARWDYDWSMLPLPEGSVKSLGVAEVDCYWVPKGALHPEEALLLARYLSDRWETAGYQMPARKSLANSTGYRQSAGDEATTILDNMPDQLLIIPTENATALEQVSDTTLTTITASSTRTST
jgi:hypothetical protein